MTSSPGRRPRASAWSAASSRSDRRPRAARGRAEDRARAAWRRAHARRGARPSARGPAATCALVTIRPSRSQTTPAPALPAAGPHLHRHPAEPRGDVADRALQARHAARAGRQRRATGPLSHGHRQRLRLAPARHAQLDRLADAVARRARRARRPGRSRPARRARAGCRRSARRRGRPDCRARRSRPRARPQPRAPALRRSDGGSRTGWVAMPSQPRATCPRARSWPATRATVLGGHRHRRRPRESRRVDPQTRARRRPPAGRRRTRRRPLRRAGRIDRSSRPARCATRRRPRSRCRGWR